MKKIIALAALAAISATASAAGNLFTDGSFESLSSGGGWTIDTGSAGVLGDGWTVGLAPKTASGGAPVGLEVRQSGVAGTAEDGKHFIELDGNQNDMISQSLKTVAGHEYQISFYVADRPDQSAAFLATSGGYGYSIASTIPGVPGGPYTLYSGASDTGTFGTKWVEESFDFTAISTSTKFSIWATGTSDSLGTSFDNFQAVAVPEPATLGLFAAGIAVLGLSARRRRQ